MMVEQHFISIYQEKGGNEELQEDSLQHIP